ncbi:MAG: SLC13 family permease [Verrucomicrobiales bacterium]|nr:SLC13 family permease [Verrucomicrobiales bacterium]
MTALLDWFQANYQILAIYLILIATVLAFFREWAPPDLVALAAMGAVLIFGLLPLADVIETVPVENGPDLKILKERGLLSVFSNGAPITIACMFILSAGLERTGAIDAMGRFFTKIAGKSELRVLLVLMTMAAVLSAFVNNTPIVVVFLPIVLAHARATNLKASKLLIPLSFASILGGTCTLTGSSTNLIIDGVATELGETPFTMFELSKLGIIYAVIGFTYLLTVGRKLLPERSSLAELIAPQSRDFLTQFKVEADSYLIGKPLTETFLKDFKGAQVLEVKRKGSVLTAPLTELRIRERDRLLVTLHGPSVQKLRDSGGVRFEGQKYLNLTELESREVKLIEGILGPRSLMIGRTLKQIGFRRNYGVHVLAIHRQGENLSNDLSDVKLAFGDTLLMEGPVDAINRLQKQRDFVTITEAPEVKIDATKLWFGVGLAVLFILGASLKLFGLGIPAWAMIAALGMILLRCLNARQAYEAVQWNIVFLIFGMLALGLAMAQTGAAANLVAGIMTIFGNFSPFVILAVVYLLSSTLTELISNNAVAALLTPIVIGIAEGAGVDARPFIVAMMFGCSASFATPIGYQTNTYVYGAGGYKFTDFPKVGVPLNLLLWIIASILIPIFWPF